MPQGSASVPLLFLVYVSDIASGLENLCPMFTDDIQPLGPANSEAIQGYLDRALSWSVGWDLPLKLSNWQWLMEGESNPPRHMCPSGHPFAMEQGQQVREY